MTWVWYLAAIAVLLVLSALFSGSETALFSLTHADRDGLRDRRPRVSQRVERMLGNRSRTLATLLLANLLVNVSASVLFTLALVAFAESRGQSPVLYVGIGGFVMTGVLLVFGEVTPKVLASRKPGSFVSRTGPVLDVFRRVLTPVAVLLTRASGILHPQTQEPDHLSEEELHTMIRVGRERGVLLEREEEMLWNLVGLEERTVSEVMTPRIDMVYLEKGTTVREAREVFRKEGLSRLPVVDGEVDNILGIAYAKELLTATDQDAPVVTMLRPAFMVPEVKKLPPLLEELRRKGSHIAVVVDEFGQTAGLVTLEDVLEAIFGEITDEYDDAEEELPFVKTGEGVYEVEGEIDIATLNRLFRGSFDGVEHERLSALIHERLGRLPESGDSVRQNGLEIEVVEMDGNSIEKVIVRRARDQGPRTTD